MRKPNGNIRPERACAVWDAARSAAGSERTVTARCTLITPMYGGGVRAGEIDRAMPVRASGLRGQLRFWWRLLNGADRSSSDLFANESELWGGVSSRGPRASQVALHVRGAPVDHRQMVAKNELARKRPPGFPAYALVLDPGENPSFLKAGYAFELVLRFKRSVTDPQREGVIEALRWWASFAGVGARTRRGFGAVKATADGAELKPVTAEDVGRCGGRIAMGRPAGDATEAWNEAVGALQRFRQGEKVGRNPGTGRRPGRSRWPEADTIRRIEKTNARGHEPEHPVDGFFPRAAFGLPLVFHFRDRGDPSGKDGKSPVLNPAGHERMASPLILRPRFDGRRYCPAALLLPGWQERVSAPVSLDSRRGTPAWPTRPDARERLARQIEPMRAQGVADALSAFMDYFEERTGGDRR